MLLLQEVVKKRRQNAQEQSALRSSQHAAQPISAHKARTAAVHDQVSGNLCVWERASVHIWCVHTAEPGSCNCLLSAVEQ